MKELIIQDGNKPFILFSLTHLLTLAFFVLVCVGMYIFRQQLQQKVTNSIFRYSLATILIISEISLAWWLHYIGMWSVMNSLPLHLSSLSLVLSTVLLLTRSYNLFEFTYFVGVGSAIQAMITPDLQAYTFPHFRYVHFFISHGGILIANLFIVIVEGFYPTFKSIVRAFLYLNVYTAIIFLVNLAINGNYMYIMKKPVNPSILDYLGPWPYYIFSLELIALATFFMLYVPFYILKRNKQL
ncbi:TIGR02206 family membrane protein [Bacillus sp. HMF5848]|uniref:YwaF family protein n=1 Tax=Bacillus sp. HMF5848 TaxID=2495421 RepID=UPI000F773206|nr:TIGR02206 family membrane protein [Bacillus sp. HMF5848]RSK27641.1 TIGR02206 family membrane protein [Bacillus sp. HMF5848]